MQCAVSRLHASCELGADEVGYRGTVASGAAPENAPVSTKPLLAFTAREVLWAAILGAVFWGLLVGGFFLADLKFMRNVTFELALGEARTHQRKDAVYRLWVTGHGGVYVPQTEQTPPNPNLSHVPERDLVTPSGRKLTLVNPAYMTRQVQAINAEKYGVRGRITSLKLLNPENAPDPWEAAGLQAFDQGAKERVSIELMDGAPHLRLMLPFVTEKDCLKCHAFQGYREGEVRGGISVSVPMAPYYALRDRQLRSALTGPGAILLLGFAGLALSAAVLRRRISEREQAMQTAELEKERYRTIFETSGLSLWEEDCAGVLKLFEDLRREGIVDLRAHLEDHPEFIDRAAGAVEILDVNGTTLRLYRVGSKEELLGSLEKILTPESHAAFRGELVALWEGQPGYQAETVNRTFDGEEIDILMSTSFPASPGKSTRLTVSIADITELKRARSKLERYQADLEGQVRERTGALEAKTRDLERSQAAMRLLLEDVSGTKKELEAKLAQIERMNKLFVDREFRVKELKMRIERLETG